MADVENSQPSSPPKPVVSERDDTMDSKSATDPTSNAPLSHEGFEPTQLETPAEKEQIANLEAISQNSRQDIPTSPTAEVPENPKTEVEITIRKAEDEVQDKVAGASDYTKPLQRTIDNGTPSGVDDHTGSSAQTATPLVDSAVEKEPLINAAEDSASSHSSHVEIETDDESEEGKSEADRGLLHAAASPDDNEMEIRRWLEKKPNLLSTNDLGETALHLAIRYGNDKSISVLLEVWKNEKLGMNIKDGDGWTPLYTAVSSASISGPGKIVAKLLRFSEIDLAVKTDYGRTPLYLACYHDNVEVAELLLKDEKSLETLEIQEGQGRNWTPLLLACSEGELEIVKLLLSRDAKTDVQDAFGQTSLHLATLSSSLSVVQALINAQAKLDIVDSDGCTALHLAVQNLDESGNNGLEIINELIKKKARVDIPDFKGHTALQYAGRGQGDVYTEAIKLISGELNQRKRKEAFLEIFANEGQPSRSHLLENLKWDDFQEFEIELIKHEAKMIDLFIPSPGPMQADAFKASRRRMLEELKLKHEPSNPYNIPTRFDLKALSALQLAAYFGYHRLVYILLRYSGSGLNEIKQDRYIAVDIAKYVEGQVAEELEELKSSRKSSKVVIEARERRRKDFKDLIDVLNDPPTGNYDLVQGWSEIDDLDLIPEFDDGTIQKSSEMIDATIVDFHKVKDPKGGTRMDFLRRTRTVWDIVYATAPNPNPLEGDLKSKARDKERSVSDKKKSKTAPALPTNPSVEITNCGPVNIMEAARRKTARARSDAKGKPKTVYTQHNLQFRWIHLSANNLEWMMDLTKRVCRESKWSKEDFRQLAEFFRQSWRETPGKRPYMQPSCIKEDRPAQTFQPGILAAPAEYAQSWRTPGAESYSRVALYMPYITLADYDSEAEMSSTEQTDSVTDENTSKSRAKNAWKIQHKSQTLDQFHYQFLDDTTERDDDQVVSRYIKESRKKAGLNPEVKKAILRVDQVWLWVIDQETIITCSSERLDDKPDPVFQGIFSYLKEAKGKSKGQRTPATVDEMSKFITTFCIDQIDKDTYQFEKVELSPRQIFADTLNEKAEQESRLFRNFNDRTKAKLKTLTEEDPASKKVDEEHRKEQKEDYKSIDTATDLLIEIRDIRDELNMLNSLLTQQRSVWETLMDLRVNDYSITGSDNHLWKQLEMWEGTGSALKDIIEMDKVAQRIQDSMNSILGMVQNEANIFEAEAARKLSQETMRQGSTLMVFTIITIVFLPMSFLTSLFALNVTAFPHVGDAVTYKPGFIFPIIFSISAVIALPVIGFASENWRTKLLGLMYLGWLQRFWKFLSSTGVRLPHVKFPSLRNQTETKEISASALQKEDGQQLAYSESNEYSGVRRRSLGILRRSLGSHVADEERDIE